MWVNHIVNPGGEYPPTGGGGSAYYWKSNSATVQQSLAQALDGTASVQLIADAAGDGAIAPFVWPGVEGGRVFWQAYIYHGTVPGGVATQVVIRDTSNTSIAGMSARSTSATGAWTRVWGTATPTSPIAAGTALHLYVRAGGAGTVFIDRAAVWVGNPDDALAWAAQAPLLIAEVAPGYGAADLATGPAELFTGNARIPGTGWVDVTWRVRRGAMRAGRSAETEETNASTLDLTLDNRDGKLDPSTGTMGSVGMPVQVRYHDPSRGKIVHLYTGQVWTVRPLRDGPNDQVVNLSAVDQLKTIATYTWAPSAGIATIVGQDAGDQLLSMSSEPGVFNAAGGAATSTVVMRVGTADRFNALQHAQALARSDGGYLANSGAGVLFVIGRAARYAAAGTAVTFGTAAGEVPYRFVEPSLDDSYLWNDWTVVGGTASAYTATTTDATSAGLYGYRSQSIETRIQDEADVIDAAGYFAAKYAYPRLRIPSIEPNMMALGTAAPWERVIEPFRRGTSTVDDSPLCTHVMVVKRPVIGSSGGTVSHVVWQEGVNVEWDAAGVRVRVDVSPGPGDPEWFMLDSSVLDGAARLAW